MLKLVEMGLLFLSLPILSDKMSTSEVNLLCDISNQTRARMIEWAHVFPNPYIYEGILIYSLPSIYRDLSEPHELDLVKQEIFKMRKSRKTFDGSNLSDLKNGMNI